MVKVNFTLANTGLIDEGRYTVTLEKATEKKTSTKKDMVTLVAVINDDNTDDDGNPHPMIGRKAYTNFVFDPDPAADNGTPIGMLQQALIAFGADPEDVSVDGVDPVQLVMSEDGLRGNTATMIVSHSPDRQNPNITRANQRFEQEDLFS